MSDYCFQPGPVAFAPDAGDMVAQPETAPLQGRVELVAVVGHVPVEVHDTAVELAHVPDNGLRHEIPLDKVFQQALGYPPGILDVTLAPGQLLDEVGIDKLEIHGLAKLVPHGHPIDGGALHGGLRHATFYHVIAHPAQFRCQHSVGFLKK